MSVACDASLDDYVIVIPSYNRLTVFKSKTLAFLKKHGVPRCKIYVFITEQDIISYKEIENDVILQVGLLGLSNQRDFIFDFFPVGTKIVSFDDDVSDMFIKINDDLVPIASLDVLIKKGFALCEKHGASLFGVYPVRNTFFMKNNKESTTKITTNLRFIVGPFFGCINPGSTIRGEGHDEKEDYLRTIKFWLKDSAIIRFNHLSLQTRVYAGGGGITKGVARLERERLVVAKLLAQYPQYLKPKKCKSKYPEIRLLSVYKSE